MLFKRLILIDFCRKSYIDEVGTEAITLLLIVSILISRSNPGKVIVIISFLIRFVFNVNISSIAT